MHAHTHTYTTHTKHTPQSSRACCCARLQVVSSAENGSLALMSVPAVLLASSWSRFCIINYRVVVDTQVQVWLLLNRVGTYYVDDVTIDYAEGREVAGVGGRRAA